MKNNAKSLIIKNHKTIESRKDMEIITMVKSKSYRILNLNWKKKRISISEIWI